MSCSSNIRGCKMSNLNQVISALEEGKLSQLSVNEYAFLVQRCRRNGILASALSLSSHMQRCGLACHPFLGNLLVPMLCDFQRTWDAQQVFNMLPNRSELSWNALISGYVKTGKPHLALGMYHQMKKDGVLRPSGKTLVALLKACALLQDPKIGEEIHHEVNRSGLLEKDLFMGSSLLDMYIKCGLIHKAQDLFDELPIKNVISWTILIGGYADHGLGTEALKYFERMLLQGLRPNAVTLVYVLKACSATGAKDKIQELSVEIEREGLLQTDLFISSTLVDSYAKVDMMGKAREVFMKLPHRNVVCWNALITGYVEHDHNEEALECYQLMQLEGILANAVTFSVILKACGSMRALHNGQQIHMEVQRQGLLEKDTVICNALVNMYSMHGLFPMAQRVFDQIVVRDIITWTSLISGLVEHKYYEEALESFEWMKIEGVCADSIIFIYGLKACSNLAALEDGQKLHTEIEKLGLCISDVTVGNTLVDMYAKCGFPSVGQHMLERLPVRDKTSWAALIAGYSEQGFYHRAVDCFEEIKYQGFCPDTVSYVYCLKACCSLKDAEKGQAIHMEVEKKGLLENNPFLGSILVDMYAKCSLITDARMVFDKLHIRNTVSWTALISGYADDGQFDEALECLECMQDEGVAPDAATFVCCLKACGNIGASDHGRDVHIEIERRGFLHEEFVGNSLIDMYIKCDSIIKAQQVFDKLHIHDVVSWTSLMTGYVQVGETGNVFLIFEKMLGEGVKPNLITFVVLLNACSRSGLLGKSETFFQSMSIDFGINPTLEHHSCLVNLLSRIGQLDEALAMIKKMPTVPNCVVWHTLLGACKRWGTIDYGEQAFKHAMHLHEDNTGYFVEPFEQAYNFQ